MRTIKSIFVSPAGVIHDAIGTPVRYVTGSIYSHVAVGFDDFMIEAIMPAVTINPAGRYANEPVMEVIETPVTDEQYQIAVAVAKALEGKLYGLDDCLIGGVKDMFGADISHIDWGASLDCSAVHTIIFRTMFPDYLDGRSAATITPEVSRQGVLDLNGRLSGGGC